MQKKAAHTHNVVVLAWKLSSFQQLPTEKAGIWLELQRTHPKWGAHPKPSLPFLLQPQRSASTLSLKPSQLPLPPAPAAQPRRLCQGCPFPPLPWVGIVSSGGFPKGTQTGRGATATTYCGRGRTGEVGSWSRHAEPARCFLTIQ